VFSKGTLIKSLTGFCVFFASALSEGPSVSEAAGDSACAHAVDVPVASADTMAGKIRAQTLRLEF
jgi:hypothetical protein